MASWIRYVFTLLVLVLVSVLLPANAQDPTRRLTTNKSAILNDGSTPANLDFQVEIGGFPEVRMTPVGDIGMMRCVRVGHASDPDSASCICRENATDRLYGDKNCNATKNTGEEYLDNIAGTGGGGGEPSDGDKGDIIVTSSGLIWTIAPGAVETSMMANDAITLGKLAGNSVNSAKIVDLSITQADLGPDSVTETKLDVENSPTDHDVLKFRSSSGRMRWTSEGGSLASLAPLNFEGNAWGSMIEKVSDAVGVRVYDASAVGKDPSSYYSATRSTFASATCDAANIDRIWAVTDGNGLCTAGGGSTLSVCRCVLTGVTAGPTGTYALKPIFGSGGFNIGRLGLGLEVWQRFALTTLGYVGGRSDSSNDTGGNNDWPHSVDFYNLWEAYTADDCLQENRIVGGAPYHPIQGSSMFAYFHLAIGQNSGFTTLLETTTAFVGWVQRNNSDFVINSTGATASDVLQNITNGFGILWHDNVYYQVWVRSGVRQISTLLDLTNSTTRGTYHIQQRQLHALMRASWNSPQNTDNSQKSVSYYLGFYPEDPNGTWTTVPGPTTGTPNPSSNVRLIPVRAICQDVSKTADNNQLTLWVPQQWIRDIPKGFP